MKKKTGFIYGIMALIFSQGLIKILGLVYKLYLTNRQGFGDAGNAIYSSGFQIYALLLTISSIGVPNAVAKLVAESISKNDTKGADRIFKISLTLFMIIGFMGTMVLLFFAHYIACELLQIPEAELTLVSLSPSIFFVSVISVIRGYFSGLGDMGAMANSQSLEQLFKTIFTIVLVEIIAIFSKTDTKIMAAGANFATTIATIGSFTYLYKYYLHRRKEMKKKIKQGINCRHESVYKIAKKILLVTIPMSISAVLGSLNKNIDSMTVVRGLSKIMSSENAKLKYGILGGKVDTLVTLPLSFNMAFATALVPAVTMAIANRREESAKNKIRFSILTSFLIGLPCSIGMIIFAKPILELLFPNASEGAFILQISAVSIIFIMMEQTINGALQGIGKVTVPVISLLIGISIKIICNFTLIPITNEQFLFRGVEGAALGTVLCHIISCSIDFIVLKKNIKIKISFIKIIKAILASLMMGICSYKSYLLLSSIISKKMATIIAIVVAILIYSISLVILKILSEEEIKMLPKGDKIYECLTKIGIYKQKK